MGIIFRRLGDGEDGLVRAGGPSCGKAERRRKGSNEKWNGAKKAKGKWVSHGPVNIDVPDQRREENKRPRKAIVRGGEGPAEANQEIGGRLTDSLKIEIAHRLRFSEPYMRSSHIRISAHVQGESAECIYL